MNTASERIPGVKVTLQNTTYGVITDYSGNYYLELKAKGDYQIHFQALGFQDTLVAISVLNPRTKLNVTLKEEVTELESVEIISKKINVANGIIKKVRDNRDNLTNQFDNYTCTTYLKTGLEREVNEKDTVYEKNQKMSLIESVSKTTHIEPGFYHEEILAKHDYSDKEAVRTGSVVDYYRDDIITPNQVVEKDPYIFFEKVEDGNFDLYQNMVNVPNISEHPITSPVGIQCFTNYKFSLSAILEVDGQKIYEIQVEPRFKSAPLFQGQLYILKDLWVIQSFRLSINSAAMPFFQDFTVIQDYEKIEGFWVPVRRAFTYTIREASDYIHASTRVRHFDYQFNNSISERDFRNEIASYSTDAFSRDSSYWKNNRPITLKSTELEFIAEQNRIDSIKQSQHYLDSIDQAFNKITFGDVVFSGIGFRNRYKEREIYIAPLVGSFQVIGVGGFRYNFAGSYSKKFENNHQIKVSPAINYGFNNNDIKPRLGIDYTFLPLVFGNIEMNIGDTYERVTNQTTAVNYVLGTNNMIQNRFFDIAHRREIVNGLYGRVKFEFADRQPLGDIDQGSIFEFLQSIDTLEDAQLFPEPPPFERYLVSIFELKLQYRFKQKYMIKQGEKLIVGTKYPELEFTFRQGLPGLFGSEVSFNMLELKVSDEINLGNYGASNWNIIGGSFLNKKDLRVIEHRFFKESDLGFFSNPLHTHQALDSNYNTNGAYLQAFYLHHFNGFFLKKIPLIRLLAFESIAGASIMLIDNINYQHSEFFVGVERKFRMLGEYFKYGFYYVGRFNDITAPQFRFKFGLDFYNTFTNKWSW